MNYGILLLNASDIFGGGEYYTLTLAREFTTRGYRVYVGCDGNSDIFKKADSYSVCTVAIEFKGSRNSLNTLRFLVSFIKQKSVGLIHTNTSADRTIGALASYICGRKHVTSCHSLESMSHNLTHYIRNNYLTDAFIADGETIKDLLILKNHISPEKIFLINNGIDHIKYKRDYKLRDITRKALGLSDKDILIGNVARMVPFKGHDYLLKGFKKLTGRHHNVKLMLVGSGELEAELKNLTLNLNLNDRVIFTGYSEELNSLYSAMDIYIQPSLAEGGELFPYSVLYAMSHALPIVVTCSGDMPFIIDDGINGFVIPDNNPAIICESLSYLIKDENKRNEFGSNACRKLSEKYTLKKMCDDTEKLYNNILN
jgi:glycosyltransferase involved in cell wall biosynthesis